MSPLTNNNYQEIADKLLLDDYQTPPEAAEEATGPAWLELAPEAMTGLAGDLVRTIQPHSEADPVALLAHVLVAFGSLLGRGPYYPVGGSRHHANLYTVLVGATASRKGSAKDDTFFVFRTVDQDWFNFRVQSGLSSGEGLIWAVRDAIEEPHLVKDKGRVVETQTVVTDLGVKDKRLLLVEPEFASTLRVMERDGNSLSAQIRQAWDSGNLRVLTKGKAARATDAHVSIIGHTTQDELLRYLTATESANGFGNRIAWFLVRRSKFLADGGELHRVDFGPLMRRLCDAVMRAQSIGQMSRDEEAGDIWRSVYRDLAGDRIGMFGAITSRAEAQTLRFSMIYALMAGSSVIEADHLKAALALWSYAEASARLIFGDTIGDPVADAILKALKSAGTLGMSRTEISGLFKRNRSSADIQRALDMLSRLGKVRMSSSSTNYEKSQGRAEERWFYCG